MKTKIITLNKLPLNKKAYIETLHCIGDIRRRLLDLGFVKHTSIKPVFISPIGDPIAYEIRRFSSCIKKRRSKTNRS